MFEGAELGRTVSKDDYHAQIADLRTQLVETQLALRESQIPVIIIVGGVDGAGRGEVVNRLHEWLDTRGLEVQSYWEETDEERERPYWWRFWRTLPARGSIGILFGAWYTEPSARALAGKMSDAELDAEMKRIADFERMLTEDQALILKFWFHLAEDEQKRRLKALAKDPRSRWRMARKREERGEPPKYRDALRVAERMIRETDNGYAPWYLIESTDRRYRDLTVGRTLLQAMQARLEAPVKVVEPPSSHAPHLPDTASAQVTLLDHVDLERELGKGEYKDQLEGYQAKLNELVWRAYREKVSTVLVFEGWDAAGKGGAIRRLTQAMDARLYRVHPFAAPTDEERAHHYLWRFWRHIPRAGHTSIFDRSWYGRVLVERVEGFASEEEWKRAYFEINEFEEQLTNNGIVLCKFWLHISPEEQLARFKAREQTPYKQWKITEEDWRNREKWNDYKSAVNEMVMRTSTEFSEWSLIPANDKRLARVEVLRTVCSSLAEALE
jgi:polyphosphate:AMP phosphotransferase